MAMYALGDMEAVDAWDTVTMRVLIHLRRSRCKVGMHKLVVITTPLLERKERSTPGEEVM